MWRALRNAGVPLVGGWYDTSSPSLFRGLERLLELEVTALVFYKTATESWIAEFHIASGIALGLHIPVFAATSNDGMPPRFHAHVTATGSGPLGQHPLALDEALFLAAQATR